MAKKIWLVTRLEQLIKSKLVDFIVEILDKDKPILVELQKDQLYAGLNAEGQPLTPSYSSDPYFKSKDAALRYAAWKQKLNQRKENSIFPTRDIDNPNLIINGKLVYDTIFAQITDKSIIISARSSIISKIESKYNEPFGLSKTAWTFYIEEYKFIERLQDKIIKFLTA